MGRDRRAFAQAPGRLRELLHLDVRRHPDYDAARVHRPHFRPSANLRGRQADVRAPTFCVVRICRVYVRPHYSLSERTERRGSRGRGSWGLRL